MADAAVTLEGLVAAVTKMRTHQRAFFKAAVSSPERHVELIASKQAERIVDSMLERHGKAPEPQRKLFGETP